MNYKSWVLIGLLATSLISCGGEEEADATDVNTVETSDIEEDESDDGNFAESEDSEVALPSALRVAQIFNGAGLHYRTGLTHPVSAASSYQTIIDKKLAFGVYSSDLAYLVVNERFSEAQEYMGVIKALGTETGLDKVFNSADLLEKFEKNQTNREELINVLQEINIRTSDIFDTDPAARKESVIYFAGAWVEGMYIGGSIYKANPDPSLGSAVAEQMEILESIIRGLRQVEDRDNKLNILIEDLELFLNTYNGFASVAEARKNEDVQQIPELTEEELVDLAEAIALIRNKIVLV